MTPSDLLACAPRIAPSGLARVRLRKDNALGTLVPPGRDGKHLVIALDGKRGPPVRRLAKDVELVEREAPPPPKLEAACVNCGAVARLKCTKCGAVCWGVGRDAAAQRARGRWWVGWVAEGGGGGRALARRERGGRRWERVALRRALATPATAQREHVLAGVRCGELAGAQGGVQGAAGGAGGEGVGAGAE